MPHNEGNLLFNERDLRFYLVNWIKLVYYCLANNKIAMYSRLRTQNSKKRGYICKIYTLRYKYHSRQNIIL